MELDVIVIGAGAAGLAAARALRGRRVVVLEARDRIGGRILTKRVPGVAQPIELGAEFVHGAASETFALADRAGVVACAIGGTHLRSIDGRVEAPLDFWERIARTMKHLDPRRDPDRSVRAALDDAPIGEEDRALALHYVAGFHAADPDRASERAVARAESGDEDRDHRLAGPYDAVVGQLADGLDVRLGTIVTGLEWRRGRVRVRIERGGLDARAAIVTVPLGVLKAPPGERGAIEIAPEPPALRRARESLDMGHVARVVLRLRAPLGELIDRPGVAFVHGDAHDFPVWWTPHPLRAPFVVGWSGNPNVRALERHPDGSLDREAVGVRARHALVGLLGDPRIQDAVEDVSLHDWSSDPFARGAYTYALVGGEGAGAALAQPIEGTLFFAGEVTAGPTEVGTVEGALKSGRRAARAVELALGGELASEPSPG